MSEQYIESAVTDPETAEHLCDKCVDYAHAWTPFADDMWAKEEKK